jgi:hypothetical protein
MTLTRGVEAILDKTFLSVLATPIAALLGMVIAWLVVRKKFTGKDALDFASNLGGAVPGTILGIGFVMAFNKPPLALAIVIYALLALFYAQVIGKRGLERIIILVVGTAIGVALTKLEPRAMYFSLGGIYLVIALVLMITQRRFGKSLAIAIIGVYVMSTNWATVLTKPIAAFSRSIERGFWSNAIVQFCGSHKSNFATNPRSACDCAGLRRCDSLAGLNGKALRAGIGVLALAVPCALSFVDVPFAMVWGSLYHHGCFHRSQSSGIRPLRCCGIEQIDPSIEEHRISWVQMRSIP